MKEKYNNRSRYNYYLFLDDNEKLIGYILVNNYSLDFEFTHYRRILRKVSFTSKLKKLFKKNEGLYHVFKYHKYKQDNIYSDIIDFLKVHKNNALFVCLDYRRSQKIDKYIENSQVSNFFVANNTALEKKDSIGMVLDTMIIMKRLEDEARV